VSHLGAHVGLGDIGRRVALEVHLAALPRHAGKAVLRAARSPSWLSLVTISSPLRPRLLRPRRNWRQCSSASLIEALTPSTERCPSCRTPTAISRAQDTTAPSIRTFSYLASRRR